MYYTVYKTKNNFNGKYYIGVHKTTNINDSYMGSGNAIKEAIRKYGKENFTKEILFVYDNEEEAYMKERELTEHYCHNDNYNMRLGGVGGFTKENAMNGYEKSLKKRTKEQRRADGIKGYSSSLMSRNHAEDGRKGGLRNKGIKKAPHSEETKRKISESVKRSLENKKLGTHIGGAGGS